jgi:hypothetical protein
MPSGRLAFATRHVDLMTASTMRALFQPFLKLWLSAPPETADY